MFECIIKVSESKYIVQIFYFQPISVGKGVQFAVICVVIVVHQLIRANRNFVGVAEGVVDKRIRRGLGCDLLQTVGILVIRVGNRGTVGILGVAVGGCIQRRGEHLRQIAHAVVLIAHTVALGVRYRQQATVYITRLYYTEYRI